MIRILSTFRALGLIVCLLGVALGVSAQPTSVPPPTATPAGGTGTTAPDSNPATAQLRVNPDFVKVIVHTSDGTSTSALIAAAAEGAEAFIPNPTDPGQFVTVDGFGTFTLWTNNQGQGLPAPFTPFAPADRASNDKLVVNAAWTPDGKTLAVVLDNADRKSAEDGVYWWEIGVTGANQIMHNCRPGAVNCNFFVSSDNTPGNWYATSAAWSPNGETLLVRAYMDGYGYDGFMLLSRSSDRTQRPPFCPYEFSEWTPDGTGIVVSGRDLNNLPTLGVIAADDCAEFEPAATWGTAWYTRNGVMRPDGSLVALGRVGAGEGAFKLIDGDGNELSQEIGFSTPIEVRWNASANVVYVRNEDGRAYVASIDGGISEVTDLVAGVKMAAWVEVR